MTLPVLPQSVRTLPVTLVNGDGTTAKTLFTADGTLNRIEALNVTSDDTSNRVLQVLLTVGATDYLLGSVTIPTLAGTDGVVAAVNVLASSLFQGAITDAYGNRVLPLDTGVVVKVKAPVAITSAKTMTITAIVTKY